MLSEKIPADPEKLAKAAAREQEISALNAEYLHILQELPDISSRINELEMISDTIHSRLYNLTLQKESMEMRKDELKKMLQV